LNSAADPRAIGVWIRETAKRLEATSETARVDAEYLVAHCVHAERRHLLARQHEIAALPALEELVQRRLRHEPIAYILGEWEFFGVPLAIRPPVLVPRPETELLVEVARGHAAAHGLATFHALDLCTGSGCIALAMACATHAEMGGATVDATDINPEAVNLAEENIRRHQKQDCVHVYHGDLFDALDGGRNARGYDIIVSNPPYVSEPEYETLAPDIREYEDPAALLAGPDGLAFYRRIIAEAPGWLREGGLLALEIGEDQAQAVKALMTAAGFESIDAVNDLAGIERVVSGIKPPIIRPGTIKKPAGS